MRASLENWSPRPKVQPFRNLTFSSVYRFCGASLALVESEFFSSTAMALARAEKNYQSWSSSRMRSKNRPPNVVRIVVNDPVGPRPSRRPRAARPAPPVRSTADDCDFGAMTKCADCLCVGQCWNDVGIALVGDQNASIRLICDKVKTRPLFS